MYAIRSYYEVLESKWVDDAGNVTTPHMAKAKSLDTRLEGHSQKDYVFNVPKGATYARYTFSYRLISEKMANRITSYNVCYTKLLRHLGEPSLG